MLGVVIFILALALIVIVHEWGHYIMAKMNGVLVHEFAVGMGPKVWAVKRGETLYSIRAIPIGGFCSMQEEVGNSDNSRSMCSKKPWQKFLIVSFGAIMNFIFAWVLFSILAGYVGYGSNVIKTLDVNMPASEAKLLPGDKIIAIDGVKVTRLSDITETVQNKDKAYIFTILRSGNESFNVELKARWIEKEQTARFGFAPQLVHFDLLDNMHKGLANTIMAIRVVWNGLIELLSFKVPINQLAGPLGVAGFSAKQWTENMNSGGISEAVKMMIYIAAFLSANIGMVNLLPIPALDGARIVFILLEKLRGRPLAPEKESAVHFIGFVLLMLLTVVILYNDAVRMFNI